MTLTAGFYEATIADYGIKTTAKGDPAVTILFRANDGNGGTEDAWWQGGFSNEMAVEISLKALAECGLERGEDIERLAEGPSSDLLDMQKRVRIKIQMQPGLKDPGRMYAKVAGVYNLESQGIRNAVTTGEAQSLMAGLNLAASFAQIKNAMPKPTAEDLPPAGF